MEEPGREGKMEDRGSNSLLEMGGGVAEGTRISCVVAHDLDPPASRTAYKRRCRKMEKHGRAWGIRPNGGRGGGGSDRHSLSDIDPGMQTSRMVSRPRSRKVEKPGQEGKGGGRARHSRSALDRNTQVSRMVSRPCCRKAGPPDTRAPKQPERVGGTRGTGMQP